MKKIETWVLLIYTVINIKFLSPFIFDNNLVEAAALDPANSAFLALFVGSFMNAALIIYCLRQSRIN